MVEVEVEDAAEEEVEGKMDRHGRRRLRSDRDDDLQNANAVGGSIPLMEMARWAAASLLKCSTRALHERHRCR